ERASLHTGLFGEAPEPVSNTAIERFGRGAHERAHEIRDESFESAAMLPHSGVATSRRRFRYLHLLGPASGWRQSERCSGSSTTPSCPTTCVIGFHPRLLASGVDVVHER